MQVKPVIKLLKQTLVGTGALLVTAAFLFTFATPVEDFIQSTFATKENTSNTSASKSSTKFNIRYTSKLNGYQTLIMLLSNKNSPPVINLMKFYRKEELVRLPAEVRTDDDLAAAAAEAADGRPVYCRDRYHRALAGGQYCKWDDLLK